MGLESCAPNSAGVIGLSWSSVLDRNEIDLIFLKMKAGLSLQCKFIKNDEIKYVCSYRELNYSKVEG